MYHPTSRVLAVLALLQSHGRLTGPELAQRLEINIRTVRRYITMLQDLGIPIIAERGRAGRYELTAGYKLPPMMFTNEEALALAVGLLTARNLGLAETARAVESAQAKLEQVLPLELKQHVRAINQMITLDLPVVPTSLSGSLLQFISSAAQEQQRIHIRYRSRVGEETERDLDPYGLAFHQGCWYVVGYCGLRDALRSFRLDRIVQADQTSVAFTRQTAVDPLAYLVQSLATLPRQYTFELLLKTDFATAQRESFDVFGVLEPHPHGVRLRGSADDLDWLARMLSRFSFDFTIHAPRELHDALRRHAESLLNIIPSC
jgi:predicted DNA-binding transcriptional regulator YafY